MIKPESYWGEFSGRVGAYERKCSIKCHRKKQKKQSKMRKKRSKQGHHKMKPVTITFKWRLNVWLKIGQLNRQFTWRYWKHWNYSERVFKMVGLSQIWICVAILILGGNSYVRISGMLKSSASARIISLPRRLLQFLSQNICIYQLCSNWPRTRPTSEKFTCYPDMAVQLMEFFFTLKQNYEKPCIFSYVIQFRKCARTHDLTRLYLILSR